MVAPNDFAMRLNRRTKMMRPLQVIDSITLHLWPPGCLEEGASAESAVTTELNLRDRVARQILQYLLEHRAAADSVKGVRLWWLRDGGEISEADVGEVLETLVKQEWLVAHGKEIETRIFGLNERNIEAVMQFAKPGERRDG